MNFSLFSVCLLATIVPIFGKPLEEDEIKAIARQLIEQCKEKAGASDSDIEALKEKKLPETHEGLCMLECVFETSQIMPDGKFSKDGMITAFEPMMNEQDADTIENGKKLAETCANEIGDGDDDKCITAKMVVECIVKHAPSHGFAIPEPHAA
nr:odorant-binding protein 3 [Lytta caraganae]